tara:strand:- start:613 stop:1317 length:705 start_codon:yes stop_codon:yes gene_type:complete
MQGKKSFVLYSDVKDVLDLLPDEQAGKLFKLIVDYVNDNDPESDDPLVKLAFAPIKAQLKRDLNKWQGIREKRSEAGKKSAQVRAEKKETNLTLVEIVKQTSTNDQQTPTNLTVNDNVNVNVNVNDNVNVNVNANNNLKLRKTSFGAKLKPYLEQFGEPLLKEFYEYWTEHNEQGQKMRFEYSKNQPFNVSRRLATWSKKNKEQGNFKNGTKKQGDGIDADYLTELQNRIKGEQ